MKKYIIAIVVIIGIMFVLFGSVYIYSSNNVQDNSTESLKEKADEEIEYLAETIVSMMNKFNNITYANYKIIEEEVNTKENQNNSSSSSPDSSQNEQQGTDEGGGSDSKNRGETQSDSSSTTNINLEYSSVLVNPNDTIEWDYIKKETEKMYATWTSVLIDLNSLNVNRDNLLKYNFTLDNITKALENKNKETSIMELANLYGLLSSYMKDYSSNTKMISILDTKSNILYAYALAEYNDKWSEMKEDIKKAQSAYMNIINSQVQNNVNTNSINKAYILLNEIEKTTDKNIFYINYKNLMQELDAIEA